MEHQIPNQDDTKMTEESDREDEAKKYAAINFPDRVDQVIRISIRLYIKNFLGLLRLSLYITIPFALIYFLLFMINTDIPPGVNIIVLGVLSMVRNNLLEAAITLILPGLLFQNASVSSSFMTFFLRNTAPKIIIWSIIFSLCFFLANFIFPVLGGLFLMATLFVVPLIAISQVPKLKPDTVLLDNLKIMQRNPFLAISGAVICNVIIFIPAGVLLLISTSFLFSAEEMNTITNALQASDIEKINVLFTGTDGNYKGFLALSVIEVLVFPLKFLIFSMFFMLLMNRFLPEKLNNFFHTFGLNIVNLKNDVPKI